MSNQIELGHFRYFIWPVI